jgi:LmbE family N-acetylglucosaminyl deacetylase
MRILVIAPHPDDEVLGCGGTIARCTAAGDCVNLCVVTRAHSLGAPESEMERRRAEVHRASEVLGITEVRFLDFPTVKLDTVPLKDLIGSIGKVMGELAPEVLYVPHHGDVNTDHQVVFRAAMIAARPKPSIPLRKVLCYETLSQTEWAAPFAENAFLPNVFVDISKTLEIKLRAMSAYQLELQRYPHPRSREAISNLAGVRGATIGVAAAEAFMLVREIVVETDGS